MNSFSDIFTQFSKYGIQSLTNGQLVSAVLHPRISTEIYNHYNMDLAKVGRKDWKQIRSDSNLNTSEAQKVEMLFGLSQRIQEAEVGYNIQINSPKDAVAYLQPKLKYLSKEHFIVVYLNNAKYIIGNETVSKGGTTATIVETPEIMRLALLNEASSIILAHNHPSGNAKQSRADIEITKRISEAGKVLSIPVDDHIIIAGNHFTSFRAKGLIS